MVCSVRPSAARPVATTAAQPKRTRSVDRGRTPHELQEPKEQVSEEGGDRRNEARAKRGDAGSLLPHEGEACGCSACGCRLRVGDDLVYRQDGSVALCLRCSERDPLVDYRISLEVDGSAEEGRARACSSQAQSAAPGRRRRLEAERLRASRERPRGRGGAIRSRERRRLHA
jgi:hypothetical protein